MYHFTNKIAYIDFPDLFYSEGKNTKTSDEENFTQKFFIFENIFQKNLFKNIDFGSHYTLIYRDIYKYELNKQIAEK